MIEPIALSRVMKNCRKKHGIKQDELAVFMGITRRYYSYLEKGERNVTLEQLEMFSEFIGVSLSEVFAEYEAEKALMEAEAQDGLSEEIQALVSCMDVEEKEQLLAYIKSRNNNV